MTTRSVILRGRRSAPPTTTPTEQLDTLWELVRPCWELAPHTPAPGRVQRKREKGWKGPEGCVYVGRPAIWGNPFGYYKRMGGLVRHQPEFPGVFEYEGRISSAGIDHPYFHPDGTVVSYRVRWATEAEIVELFARTLLRPDRGMVGASPSTAGNLSRYTVEDVQQDLRGQKLSCWCPLDKPCHADVLLAIANAPKELHAR